MNERYAQFLRNQPWALRADVLKALMLWSAGATYTPRPVGVTLDAATKRSAGARAGTVAVVPVYGMITQHPDLFMEFFGMGTSTDSIRAALREVVGDPGVAGVLLDVDSPGGSVVGVDELAAEIRVMGESKPILALANGSADSAAYWLAASATETWMIPSGEVGSIGVFASHEDLSGMLEQMGVKMTLISAGKYKTEGNPYEPLSDEAKVEIQARVDTYYSSFKAAVAKGRGVSVSKVEKDFGQGRVVMAKDALAAGMVDKVGTFDEAVARLASGKVSGAAKARATALPDGVLMITVPAEGMDITVHAGEVVEITPVEDPEAEVRRRKWAHR